MNDKTVKAYVAALKAGRFASREQCLHQLCEQLVREKRDLQRRLDQLCSREFQEEYADVSSVLGE